jgi:hypothetical protein
MITKNDHRRNHHAMAHELSFQKFPPPVCCRLHLDVAKGLRQRLVARKQSVADAYDLIAVQQVGDSLEAHEFAA